MSRNQTALHLPDWYDPSSILTKHGSNFLGSGGFGNVLLCYNDKIGLCAVKCISTTLPSVNSNDARTRFKDEAGIILLASHENIVHIYGITQFRGWFGLIMKYMEMGNLTNIISLAKGKNYQIPFEVILRVILDVACGLTFLHNIRGNEEVVHGDLKPLNVLIDENFSAKLSDFGGSILKTFTQTGNHQNEGQRKETTYRYTAPERLQDINLVATKSSDVYSFAMIIYECLTDQIPYKNCVNSFQFIMGEIIKGTKPTLDQLDEKKAMPRNQEVLPVIQLLEDTMKKCWEHVASKRPRILTKRNTLLGKYKSIPQDAFHNKVASAMATLASSDHTIDLPLALGNDTVAIDYEILYNQHPTGDNSSYVQLQSHPSWEDLARAVGKRDFPEIDRMLVALKTKESTTRTNASMLAERIERKIENGELEDAERDVQNLSRCLEQTDGGGQYEQLSQEMNQLCNFMLQKNFPGEKLAGLIQSIFTICSSIQDAKKKGEQLVNTAETMKHSIIKSGRNCGAFLAITGSLYQNLARNGCYSNIESLKRAQCYAIVAQCFEKLGKRELKEEADAACNALFK